MEKETTQVEMTAAEQLEFEAFRAGKIEKERKQRERENREAYKALVTETIDAVFPSLMEISLSLQTKKAEVYDAFQEAITLKTEIYEVPADQRSNTFTNASGTRRIILGQYTTDN